MQHAKRLRWVYWPPLVHLAICLVALLGYVTPGLQFLGIFWGFLTLVDIPVSMVTIALAFSQHEVFAGIWATIAGTLWWYLVCRAAEFLAGKIRRPGKIGDGKT